MTDTSFFLFGYGEVQKPLLPDVRVTADGSTKTFTKEDCSQHWDVIPRHQNSPFAMPL